ncbi:uncharacterized protein V1518DRAFT_403235 [Limtongia smithiae]|uniref:uncharacterized protein n=1 Tax=Limtongia smithiae TaxID=1125753 RepID=UPI0034CFC35E
MAPTVTKSTDPLRRDTDIDRALHGYGMIEAFKLGKMPTNGQLDIALGKLLKSDIMNTSAAANKQLSADSQAVLRNVVRLIECSRSLLVSKNKGNLLQEFLWHSSLAAEENNGLHNGRMVPPDDATLIDHGAAVDGLKDLGLLIITNGEFRKLLSDAVVLMRDIVGDVGAKAVGQIKPDQDELAQIDNPVMPGEEWAQNKDEFKQQASDVGNSLRAKREDYMKNGLSDGDQAQIDRFKSDTKDYLSKKVPPERREQIIERLKRVVVSIQSHPDYQSAIDSLLDLVETYSGYLQRVSTDDKTKDASQKFAESGHFKAAQSNLRLLIERLANDTSLAGVFSAVDDIYRAIENDNALKSWFHDVDSYLRKCLKHKGYMTAAKATEDYTLLSDRGKDLFTTKYRGYADRFSDEISTVVDGFESDPWNQKFASEAKELASQIGTDKKGNLVFKSNLIKDIGNVVLPELVETIHYLPLPRIEYSDRQIDVVIENLVLQSANLLPNLIEVRNHSFMRWMSQKSTFKRNSFMLRFSGIQCDMRDVNYYLYKKTGMWQPRDIGLVDIFLGRSGLSFTVQLSAATELSGSNKYFQVDDVTVTIASFDLKLKRSRYRILFSIFKPLLISLMKSAMKLVLQKQIRQVFNDLDETMYRINLRKKALEDDSADAEEKPSTFGLYSQAAKSEMKQIKEKNAERKRKSPATTNVTLIKENSMFPKVVFPQSVTSTKASKYKALASEGDKWMSPVFNLTLTKPGTGVSFNEKSTSAIARTPTAVTSATTGAPATITRRTTATTPTKTTTSTAPATDTNRSSFANVKTVNTSLRNGEIMTTLRGSG